MIKELNDKISEQYGLDFDQLLDSYNIIEDSYRSHRRDAVYVKQTIFGINECNYPHINKELHGFWESNEYVCCERDGFDKRDIIHLNRVEPKERTIIQKYWEKV
jgi:hypothetical protein